MSATTRSMLEVYVHIVWTTHRRQPFLIGEVKRCAYRAIVSECEHLGAQVLAIGGIEDHIHLVIRLSATSSIANITKRAKGVSSHYARSLCTDMATFRWQEGYAAFSVSSDTVADVIEYVRSQAARHGHNRLRPAWERNQA